MALYVGPHRVDAAIRIGLVVLARLFDWRDAVALIRRMANNVEIGR